MRVYLLNPPYMPHFERDTRWQDTGRGGTLYYPIWLSYATGLLGEHFATRLIDAPVKNWDIIRVIADIKEFATDLLVLDTSFPTLNHDLGLAALIKKEYPAVKIVVVGPPASQYPDRIITSPGVDFTARWEYDLTLLELAQTLSSGGNLSNVKGLSYLDNGKVRHNPDREFTTGEDLDRIPFVSKVYKKHLNIEDYFLNYSLYPEVQIFASRGCPFQCTFCCWTQTFTGRKFRIRSVGNFTDEFEWISKNLPQVRQIFIEDDTFTVDKEWVQSFCDEYTRRGLKIPWACQCRADVDYKTLRKMKKANCRVVVVGFESGSDEILETVKKGITVEKSKRFIQEARQAKMPVHGNYIIGLPGENKETIALTKKLARESKTEAITVAVTTPFPGTELYKWAKENKYLTTEDPNQYLDAQGHQKSVISYPWLSSEDVNLNVDKMLKGYYLTPRYVPIAFRRIFQGNFKEEVERLWISTKAFLKYLSKRKQK